MTTSPDPAEPTPHNLPSSPTPLIGRAVELAAIAAELEGERLVTLTGSGGIGKTRLAARLGAELVDRFTGGVWWADLAPIGEGSAIATTLLAATGLNEDGMRPAVDTLKDMLSRAPTLVIFDNCEHLVADAAAVIDALRAACPALTVLATSREPLGLPGEVTWRVPSLSLPPREGPFDIETLGQYDAVRLFLDRARRARPAMRLSDAQAAAISEICHRLDGVALAIEVAAARCRQRSPERILDDLAQRFRLLTGGARTLLPRQQTLLASVEWSHDLLDVDESKLLRRLGVFAGPFRLDAAEAIGSCAGDLDLWAVLDLLGRLVDKSLVQIEEFTDGTGGSDTQYRLHETVRQFAVEQARDADELARLRDAHADWWIAELGRRETPASLGATSEIASRHALDLRAALDWLEADLPRRYELLRLVGYSWFLGGRFDDTMHYARRWLADGPAPNHEVAWARAYASAAIVLTNAVELPLLRHGNRAFELVMEHRDARSAFLVSYVLLFDLPTIGVRTAEMMELCLAEGEGAMFGWGYAWLFIWIGYVLCEDRERGARIAEQIKRQAAASSDPVMRAWANGTLPALPDPRNPSHAMVTMNDHLGRSSGESELPGVRSAIRLVGLAVHGRTDHADELLADLARSRHLPIVRMWYFGGRGFARMVTNTPLDAKDLAGMSVFFSGSTAQFRYYPVRALISVGAADRAADMIAALPGPGAAAVATPVVHAALALHEGRVLDAARHIEAAMLAEVDDTWDELHPDLLEVAAAIAFACDDHARAMTLVGASQACRSRNGVAYRWRDQQRWLDDGREAAMAAIGSDAAMGAFARGEAMTSDAALAWARRGAGERKRPSAGWDSLTPTELEVCALLAEGLTNPQIAERLIMSRATVKTHLSHCLAKLGMATRSEIAVGFTRRSLHPA